MRKDGAKGKVIVVKVQAPLAGAPFALIYNRDRSVVYQQPMNMAISRLLNGHAKGYFNARVGTEIHIEGLASQKQDW